MQPSAVIVPIIQAIAPPIIALLFVNVELMTFTSDNEDNIAPPPVLFNTVLFVNVQSMISIKPRSTSIAPPPLSLPFANVIFCIFILFEFEMKSILVRPCPSSIVEFPMILTIFSLSVMPIGFVPLYMPGSR